jgi:hypothetical protein
VASGFFRAVAPMCGIVHVELRFMTDDVFAVFLEGAKARLQCFEHVSRPIRGFTALRLPLNEFFQASNLAPALIDVLIGLDEMPALLIRIVHCRALSSTRRPASAM